MIKHKACSVLLYCIVDLAATLLLLRRSHLIPYLLPNKHPVVTTIQRHVVKPILTVNYKPIR